MSDASKLRELIAASLSLRLGPWDREGLYNGLRYLCKHLDWYGTAGYPEREVNTPDADDAELIVEAVNALPGLIAEIESLKTSLSSMSEAMSAAGERHAAQHKEIESLRRKLEAVK